MFFLYVCEGKKKQQQQQQSDKHRVRYLREIKTRKKNFKTKTPKQTDNKKNKTLTF